ncbi:mannitol dehydrogenase family protein [Flaviflexus sp.]|uniref:mannitol dehydrogenase family protein n=1 Tax=Flaviflexus sp. TaxID=1969482 RepID=UPI003F914412
MSTQLTRSTHGRPAAPVRILHVGLGNFMRAHQAWYTEKASNADEWGIAAFTGRRPLMAELLTPQDGLYTLITKEAAGNSYEVISSIVAVHPASDFASFIGYFESSDLSIVTSTVTEVGYCRRPDGSLDLEDARVAADLEALKELVGKEMELGSAELSTAPAKILAGLLARRAAGVGPLTILPCDNLPDNGSAFARVVTDAAREVDPSIVQWMDENVSWATCMVDRITPATSDADRDECEKVQGYADASPVPTEPFSEWVISGDFPAGRPDWEVAGAQIVEDVEPYEQRKLWMLNGSHSLMAYAAPILGHETVADAIGDQVVRGWVQNWWEEAGSGLQVEWEDYAAALLARYENPNIRHLLAQIAHDGSQKIPVRIAPTLINQRTEGKLPVSAVKAVAAWMLHLQGYGAPVVDKSANKVASQLNDNATKNAEVVLNYVAPELSGDAELVTAIADAAEEILSFVKE